MIKYLILFMFICFDVYAATLDADTCSIDVTFYDNGAVRLENIKGKCDVKFYIGSCSWGHYYYNLDDNVTRRGDTFMYVMGKTDKVCVDDICVSK